MNPSAAIVAVGDLVWDVLVKPDGMLLPGGDTTGQIQLAPGGSAANVAAWIARCGMPAGFVGAVGRDVFGDLIVESLAAEGVQMHIHRTAARDTGVILALIDRAGQRSHVTNQGADFQLLPEDLPEEALRAARHVHITAWSLFTDPPRAAAIRAAQLAKAAGATVSFDPASYQMIREMGHDRFARATAGLAVDILFPNRDEGEALTGERAPDAIARELRATYPGAVVALKLDSEGCFVAADGHARHYPAPVAKVVDTTGAGDAFDGAFLARYLRDGDFARAAELANSVGGWVVARDGARPAVDEELRGMLVR
jgi:ribokinase